MVQTTNISENIPDVIRNVDGRTIARNLIDLNRKSILFEVISRKNPSKPVEAYILNIPPESVEIEEPQRVSRTKTFGGQFEDDYGPDNLRITISGNTGSTHLRKTYALDTNEELDGKSAFFYFRNHIIRYKGRVKNYQDYDLIMYDLSSAYDALTDEGHGIIRSGRGMDAYVVSLDKFKLSRSKEKPLFYNYTIELETLRVLGTTTGETKSPVKQEPPIDWIGNLRRSINSIGSVLSKVKDVKDQAESSIDLAEEVVEKITNYWERTVDILTYPTGLIKRFFGAIRNIGEALDQTATATLLTIYSIEDDVYSLIDSTKQNVKSSSSLVTYSKTPNVRGSQRIPLNSISNSTYNMNILYGELSDTEAEIKSLIISAYKNGLPESSEVEIYGYIPVIADAGTTMEGLSAEYYNNPSLWEIIAIVNSILDDSEIEIGSTIRVPVLVQGGTNTNNFIFSSFSDDIYGKDIRIDGNGNLIATAAGDLAVQEGVNNLVQALNIRLNEFLGYRLRLTVYGIRSFVGSASTAAPITYILANIRDTIMQDPRVAAVDNIKLKGVGDKLYVSFDIRTIRVNEIVPFTGTI